MKYNNLLNDLSILIENENYESSLLANFSSFIFHNISNLNWVGFYLNIDNKLVLSSFQGNIACSEIPFNQGVCGEAFTLNKTIVVQDVSIKDNHIYCDKNSQSEIVIPITINHYQFGVLDIDSSVLNRFDDDLVSFLKRAANLLINKLVSLI